MHLRLPDQPIVARTFGVLALAVIASTTVSPISLTAQRIDTPRSNLYKKIEAYTIDEKTDG